MRLQRLIVVAGIATLVVSMQGITPARAASWTPPQPTYQLNDTAQGRALSVLPPGEHGLFTAADVAAYEGNGTRPSGSQDQLGLYANLLYHSQGLTDSQLSSYYIDESFGVPANLIARTETPSASVNAVIYRDQHDVPHIYGDNQPDVAFGAGYAAAEDRLFQMDVLRHYGAGNLASFLGPSCAYERMDHDSLLLGGYSIAQKQAQINALPVLYGALGQRLVDMVNSYVAGINAYITAAETNPVMYLPADYAALVGPPQPWVATDVIDIATLVGGIFGKGGGSEVKNAYLWSYLKDQLGAADGAAVFRDLKSQNDAGAPTTASQTFPYATPGTVDPNTTAIPDRNGPFTDGTTNTTANCSTSLTNPAGARVVMSFIATAHGMSNALLVDGAHSVDGHPIAVMGPQVSYYTPQILMEEDLHATDGSYDVSGASFPGTNFLVELGRGRNFAWSATSAETDNVDQRLEIICDPNGGTASATGTFYMLNGQCVPMQQQQFNETALPKPGAPNPPVIYTHTVYYTNSGDPIQGVVQGWTTANGNPVAIVNQRSTYNHEVDSGVGFMSWGMPSLTYDSASWMAGAAKIAYTFNWFYVDTSTIAYYESGLLPIRPSNVDPNLPTWGDGRSEWQGFLAADAHVHQVGSPTGYLVSWNNKGAPGFSAADDKYSWGPVQRVQSLQQEIQHQFSLHGGLITRANLVTAMETAASVDLTGRQVLPHLLPFAAGDAQPPGVTAMLQTLQQWLDGGALRRKAAAGDTQYADAAAVAIMDQLTANLTRAIFDPVIGAGTVFQSFGLDAGYSIVPMAFTGPPGAFGGHSGSAYQDGWEGYVQKVLQQASGASPAQPLSTAMTGRVCGASGLASCHAAVDAALLKTYNQLALVNGNSNVATWTADTQTQNSGQAMPVFDDIQFSAVGVVGQPPIDWQNRPTFQQVVEFPLAAPVVQTPEVPFGPLLPLTAAAALGGAAALRRRRAPRPAP